MKSNKALTLALAALVAALVAGCDKQARHAGHARSQRCELQARERSQVKTRRTQQEFSSLCLRRGGDFKPSRTRNEW